MFLLSFSPSHFAHVLKVYFVEGSTKIHRNSRGYENGAQKRHIDYYESVCLRILCVRYT